MIALVVKLSVHPERLQRFLAAIEENAERTFNDEPGCRYFDVAQDGENPLDFVFYELYDDEAALAAHKQRSHFFQWRKEADACVVSGSQINLVAERLFHFSGSGAQA